MQYRLKIPISVRVSAGHSPISVYRVLPLPSLLQKLLEQLSLTQFALFIKSCILPCSPLMLEQSSYSPGEHFPSLLASSSSLPKGYFFLVIVFSLRCVFLLSSWSVKQTNKGAKENKCHLPVTSPLPLALNSPHWSFSERKQQDKKQQQTHSNLWKLVKYIKSQFFCWLFTLGLSHEPSNILTQVRRERGPEPHAHREEGRRSLWLG